MLLTHCVVKKRLATSPRREATSCIVMLFHDLYHLFNRVAAKLLRLSYGIINVRLLVLMKNLNGAQEYEKRLV